MESLSPDQKAELLLDPSTGALENVTVVKEVLSSILKAPDEEQLEKFFETFVEVSKEVSLFTIYSCFFFVFFSVQFICNCLDQECAACGRGGRARRSCRGAKCISSPTLPSQENITYITNAEVRDAILNLTLTALAPKFPLFQTSDYELWFQINLVVLLASFSPSVLVVIPANLTCDSYDAM